MISLDVMSTAKRLNLEICKERGDATGRLLVKIYFPECDSPKFFTSESEAHIFMLGYELAKRGK